MKYDRDKRRSYQYTAGGLLALLVGLSTGGVQGLFIAFAVYVSAFMLLLAVHGED